jgi:glucosamine-6-phosphate deaminase
LTWSVFGIGENGHLAFNDPPVADFADSKLVKIVELDEVCRQQQVHDGCFPRPRCSATEGDNTTLPALLRGRRLFCAVPGPEEGASSSGNAAWTNRNCVSGDDLRRHENATLYLDRQDSAALLGS